MYSKSIILLFFGLIFAINASKGKRGHKIVTYWGQNAIHNSKTNQKYWEKDLVDFCKGYNYDIINLAFLNTFFDSNNKDRMPGFNFAYHCHTAVSTEYPTLLRCPKIEAGIKECQKRGKKVLMSLGGARGNYGFDSQDDALLFAYRIYHLILGGNELKEIRPFGKSVLDGVDLDIEGMDKQKNRYYTTFVKELRRLEKTGVKKYLITAAPQCPFPDRYLGPEEGKVLGDVPELIDEIYIQFYNNWCHTANKKVFNQRLREWISFSHNYNGPIIYIGLPANKKASGNPQHFRPVNELQNLYKDVKDTLRLGGIMLWDASFDQNNMPYNKHYSEHIEKMMRKDEDDEESIKTTKLPELTKMKSTQHKTTVLLLKTTQKTTINPKITSPTKQTKQSGKISCYGKNFGLFPHPSDCHQFIHCSHRIPYVKKCPANLHFNAKIKVCDWPNRAGCA